MAEPADSRIRSQIPWKRVASVLALAFFALLVQLTSMSMTEAGSRETWRATLIPLSRCKLPSRVTARVLEYTVLEGERFEAGQPLVKLESRDSELALRQAQAVVRVAEASLQRARKELEAVGELFRGEAATQSELDEARAGVAMAEARVDEARARGELARFELEACQVKAPFAGILTQRRKLPGDTVREHEILCDLVGPDVLLAVIRVGVKQVSAVQKGMRATFRSEDGQSVPGTIHSIGGQLDPASRTVRVTLRLENSGGKLWPGSSGTVVLAKA
ncbi:MAG: efflux RND transporter periplasmic adaptor subunit [Planctomycetota bacterium]